MKQYSLSLLAVAALTGCTSSSPDINNDPALITAGTVHIKGTPYRTSGPFPRVGETAYNFIALDQDFLSVSLKDFEGRPVLISSVTSLDTPLCSKQTQVFNRLLATLPKDVVVITISLDQPTAQKRFCGEHKIEDMVVLSDAARREFGTHYGLLIPQHGLLARAVMVVGRDGKLTYVEVVPEMTEHPDYTDATTAVKLAAKEPKPQVNPTEPRDTLQPISF